MSHYAVTVFSNGPEDMDFHALLAGFNETNENYYEFIPVCTKEELFQRKENFLKQNPGWDQSMTLEEYMDEFGYRYEIPGDETSRVGAMANPNAKYDYYELDARDWLYDPKSRQKTDDGTYRFRKSQINFKRNFDSSSKKDCERFWDCYVLGKKPDAYNDWMKPEYYKERFKTKEIYVRQTSFQGTYAFVTPDGKWHAPGNIGYFATSDETAESFDAYIKEWNDYISSKDDDPYVSFVDMHI